MDNDFLSKLNTIRDHEIFHRGNNASFRNLLEEMYVRCANRHLRYMDVNMLNGLRIVFNVMNTFNKIGPKEKRRLLRLMEKGGWPNISSRNGGGRRLRNRSDRPSIASIASNLMDSPTIDVINNPISVSPRNQQQKEIVLEIDDEFEDVEEVISSFLEE